MSSILCKFPDLVARLIVSIVETRELVPQFEYLIYSRCITLLPLITRRPDQIPADENYKDRQVNEPRLPSPPACLYDIHVEWKWRNFMIFADTLSVSLEFKEELRKVTGGDQTGTANHAVLPSLAWELETHFIISMIIQPH